MRVPSMMVPVLSLLPLATQSRCTSSAVARRPIGVGGKTYPRCSDRNAVHLGEEFLAGSSFWLISRCGAHADLFHCSCSTRITLPKVENGNYCRSAPSSRTRNLYIFREAGR